MSNLLQDAWQDLREKRLWPVALALALAIVAIPVLLTKSAAAPPSGEPVAATLEPGDRVAVKLAEGDAASSGSGSALDEFAKGDPFAPPAAIAKRGDASASASGPSSGGADDVTSIGGGDGDAREFSLPGAPVGSPTPVTRTETTEYEYVADVTLWTGERRRKLRGLRKLDMLPNQSAPVLIFMGASGKGGNAVFLVDSTLKAAGEGRCVPDRSNCAYVHLGPGSEHAFSTEDGASYRLRVEEIRRVKVEAGASALAPAVRKSASGGDAPRRFQLPSLVDLVAVSNSETAVPAAAPADKADRSSDATDGR
jgi:hypothetical protein